MFFESCGVAKNFFRGVLLQYYEKEEETISFLKLSIKNYENT